MKRILSFLLALLMVCNLAIPAVAVEVPTEANTFYLDVDKTSVQVDETVTLSIYSNTEMEEMMSASVLVEYDESVFELDMANSSVSGNKKRWGIINNTHEVQGKYTGTVMFDADGETTVPNGLLATIRLKALKASDDTSFAIFLTDASWYDWDTDTKNNVDVKYAGPIDMTVIGSEPITYTVTLPSGEGFTVASEQSTTVEAGEAFTFTVTVNEGYEGTPVVKAGDETLTFNADGSYTVTVNGDVAITVEGITEKQEKPSDNLIPEGAPFTALTTDAGAVLKIEDRGNVSYSGYNVYTDIPYYHVTIPEGATGVSVTHPAIEDPFADAEYGSAYGYYAETEGWTGKGMTFSFENAQDGVTVQLPLGGSVQDWMTGETTEYSFVADENGDVHYAVAVERNDYSPICFFSFEYGAVPATYAVTLPTGEGYSVTSEQETTVEAGKSFTFTVTSAEGYEKKDNFAVKAGGETLTANADGSYTVTVTGDTTITVEGIAKKTYTVQLPTSIAYIVATEQETTVAHGETFTFTVTANEGYAGTAVVKVNGTEIEAVDGSYTITVTGNVTVEIRGIELVYEGYGVRASQDKTITAGEEAEVAITVEADEATVYNAYDLTVTYDADVVNYESFTAAKASDELTVTFDEGTIRIQGYGADKTVGTAPVTLKFSGKALGAADVTIQTAKVDIGAHAIESDAPDAALLKDSTVITVTGYNVELDDGLRADSTVAQNGVDYIFYPTDSDNYTYEVTYTVGGQTYTAKTNADGSYTIPGEHITDNIVLTATMTPKSYTVTINGQDVTGEKTATYNTPYTFTVDKQSGYSYSVAVLIDNETYSPDVSGNTYTIAGTDITGPIIITVTKTKVEDDKTVTVSKPSWVTGNSTATKGQKYTFTVPKDEGYTYSDVKVTMGGTDITSKLTVSGNSYTISSVTGNIVITVTRTADMDVDVVPYITLNGGKVMYLITASGKYPSGSIAKFDGQSMYWSETYNAYAWLVVSEDIVQNMLKEAKDKVAIAQGTAAGTVNYTGDVNGTNIIDINDAQLTYDMYETKYDGFTDVSMQKFLNADVNGDKQINVADARAVVAAIQ